MFYVLKILAFLSRSLSRKMYMRLIIMAHKTQGVSFIGSPEYVDYSAHLDASGGLFIEDGVVISTHAVILSHDWSFLIGVQANSCPPTRNFYNLHLKKL